MSKKATLENHIRQTFNPAEGNAQFKTLLREVFDGQSRTRTEFFTKPEETILSESDQAVVISVSEIGRVKLDDGKTLSIFVSEVSDALIASNRVGLRNQIKKHILPGLTDAVLGAFYSPGQQEWRLTFISKYEYPDDDTGKIIAHETHPKKFTYVLGPGETGKTARDRLFELSKTEKLNLHAVSRSFSVGRMSDDFFKEYKSHFENLWQYLAKKPALRQEVFGIKSTKPEDQKPIRDFVKKLMGRLVFLYFIQKKGWLHLSEDFVGAEPEDQRFMRQLFDAAKKGDNFWADFLVPLFYKTLNRPDRTNNAFKINRKAVGTVPYLNGGLFEKDFKKVEQVNIPHKYFKELFDFLDSYNFTIVEDSPEEREIAVDPEMLGHIFENLIEDNRTKGTFYTPKEVVYFMTRECLLNYLTEKLELKDSDHKKLQELKSFVYRKEMGGWVKGEAAEIDRLLDDVKICDPAIGSGAFPMGMLLEIFQMKSQLFSELVLKGEAQKFDAAEVKEKIIHRSIYGVDIDQGAIDIARLRFWLSLIVDIKEPRPLPNLDYKLMQGDSLRESFEGIDLHFKEEFFKVDIVDEVDLFGNPVKPQTSLHRFFASSAGSKEFDLANLEEELFDTHDQDRKKEIRQKLDGLEREFIKEVVARQLEQVEESLTQMRANPKKTTAYQNKLRKQETRREELVQMRIYVGKMELYEKPYFLWHLYFKHIFDRGGFDIVIANPPYLRDAAYKPTRDEMALGSNDLYGMFLHLGAEALLKKGGSLVFITSDTWLTLSSHFALREKLLLHQLKKVVRLHPKTFHATVNTAIVSLVKKESPAPAWWPLALKLENPKIEPAQREKLKEQYNTLVEKWASPFWENYDQATSTGLIAADLTNIDPNQETPEFRRLIEDLESHTGVSLPHYAVYRYPQGLLYTNSHLPLFTASPKLFRLMDDMTCETCPAWLSDLATTPVAWQAPENKKVDVRQVQLNGQTVELVRFGDIAEVKQGLATGDNDYYLYQNPEARGNYRDINAYREYLLTEADLQKIRSDETVREKVIEKGICQSRSEKGFEEERWFEGRYIIPHDKGGESDAESGWLPNYWVETAYSIDWSSSAIQRIKSLKAVNGKLKSRFQNTSFYFKYGIDYSQTGIYSPTFRLNSGANFNTEATSIFFKGELEPTLSKVASRVYKFLLKNFIDATVHSSADKIKETSFPISKAEDEKLKELVSEIIQKQKANPRYDYLSNEQKEIDRLVYGLYGLEEADIREVETWWARRYPKLASLADNVFTKRDFEQTKKELEAERPSLSPAVQRENQLRELIARGEGPKLEFKSSLRYCLNTKKPEKYIEHSALKTVCAYLNTEGGHLLMGVSDAQEILGLEHTDYATFKKEDKADEWQKHWENLLAREFGNAIFSNVKTELVQTEGKTVAVVEVKHRAPDAVWLKNKDKGKEELYIRRSASSVALEGSEAVQYVREVWG